MSRSLFIALLLAAFGPQAPSRTSPPPSRPDALAGHVTETQHVTVTTSLAATAAAPGARVSLFLDIVPKPKMHVYSPQQKEYIPVSVKLEPSRAFRAHPAAFPKPEKYFFAPLAETQLVYSKPFRIVQDVTLSSPAALREAGHTRGSPITVAGTLRYQACDDAICYFPKDLPVSWTIRLKAQAMQ